MCRLLGYLGTPVMLQNFLYDSDSSLLKQTVAPQMLGMLNLAGFGVVAWDKQSCTPDMPFTYRSTQVAVFDRNLQALSRKVRTNALVAHVRGVPSDAYAQISERARIPRAASGRPGPGRWTGSRGLSPSGPTWPAGRWPGTRQPAWTVPPSATRMDRERGIWDDAPLG